jgi:hypothetical protein
MSVSLPADLKHHAYSCAPTETNFHTDTSAALACSLPLSSSESLTFCHKASLVVYLFKPAQRAKQPEQQGGPMEQQYDVIIVGAGLAGLRAAIELGQDALQYYFRPITVGSAKGG